MTRRRDILGGVRAMTLLECFSTVTPVAVQQRGAAYVKEVRNILGGISGVTAEVRGSHDYEVNLRLADDGLLVSCTCPYFVDRGAVCKHLWAVAVAASSRGWLTDLPGDLPVIGDIDGEIFDEGPTMPVPRPAPRRPEAWEVVLAGVMPAPRPPATAILPGAELLYIILAPTLATLSELPVHLERRERKRDGNWGKPQPARLTHDMVASLPDPDDRWALALLNSASAYPRHDWSGGYATLPLGVSYLKRPLVELVMPRLCTTGRVRLRQAQANVLPLMRSDTDVTLTWDAATAWRFQLRITGSRDADYCVAGVLCSEGERRPLEAFSLLMDGFAVCNGVASRFDLAGGAPWLVQLRGRTELTVPGTAHRGLREAVIRSGVQNVDLPDDLTWESRAVVPRPWVTIGPPGQWNNACPLQLAFEYEQTLAPHDGGASILSDGGDVLYRRDQAAELAALGRLKLLGASGIEPQPYQHPAIHQRRLPALVHALVSEGWHVAAEGIRYRTVASPSLRIRSGIDWFELDAVTEDDVALDLPAVLRAIAQGQRTVVLGDGSMGVLPEDWLASISPVLSLAARSHEGVLRFSPGQASLVEAMLAGQPAVDWDEGFTRARERLQRFTGMAPEDAPPTFVGQLRGYQREALGWLRFLREFGFGGCLADDMGLGKTVVILALLEARRVDPDRQPRPSLVVLPRSLVFNWTSEAARFAPGLRVLDFARADRHEAAAEVSKADVVLTTYGTVRRDVARLQAQRFDYVILDEAQAIKNEGTATAKAVRLLQGDHRLALTGTPVENHLGELFSLFEFLNPGLLGTGRLFDRPRGVAAVPDLVHVDNVARGLRPFILRRTKDQVAPELPPRTEETLFCELDPTARELYNQLRDHYRRVLLRKIDRDGVAKSRFAILEALLRLRQAACHPNLLAGTPPGASSAKFDVLLMRLAELADEGRKALVFSQFTSLLALLRLRLDAAGSAYEYLDGDTRDRAAPVARFQSDAGCGLFLISLKAGGTGLNLTAAENVFLLDPWWNPAVEMQAIDRTHRIGQTKPVFAYRLVARDTVEERILELQAHKRALADAIMRAGEGGLRALKREDLEQLLA
ncbi:MAG: DEAD/DEAH box helicase [Vicinamibacterales bacterium]